MRKRLTLDKNTNRRQNPSMLRMPKTKNTMLLLWLVRMSKTYIFKKAKNQYMGANVDYIGEGKQKMYFTCVDNESQKKHNITLETNEAGTKFQCECSHATFQTTQPYFCSHILSVIFYIYHKIKTK